MPGRLTHGALIRLPPRLLVFASEIVPAPGVTRTDEELPSSDHAPPRSAAPQPVARVRANAAGRVAERGVFVRVQARHIDHRQADTADQENRKTRHTAQQRKQNALGKQLRQ